MYKFNCLKWPYTTTWRSPEMKELNIVKDSKCTTHTVHSPSNWFIDTKLASLISQNWKSLNTETLEGKTRLIVGENILWSRKGVNGKLQVTVTWNSFNIKCQHQPISIPFCQNKRPDKQRNQIWLDSLSVPFLLQNQSEDMTPQKSGQLSPILACIITRWNHQVGQASQYGLLDSKHKLTLWSKCACL